MRKIKIDNQIYTIDISDGKGNLPFSMNGVGGKTVIIDSVEKTTNGFVLGTNRMLDGKVNFTYDLKKHDFNQYDRWLINDEKNDEINKIHILTYDEINNMKFKKKLNIVLWGLKYQDIEYISSGYQFGKEVTYQDFCVCFNRIRVVIFKSSHQGFIAPNYLELNIEANEFVFKKIFSKIKRSINEYLEVV